MKHYKAFTGILALALAFGLVLAGCGPGAGDPDPDPTAAEIAAKALATALGSNASVSGTTVTISGPVTLSADATVPSGVTLTIAADNDLTVEAGKKLIIAGGGRLNVNGELDYAGTIDLAATAIVNVNGTLVPSGSGKITEAQGAKIVYSSTANTGLDGVYINGTNSTWTIGAGAYITEIAGTSEPRRDWRHEISGGTVTLHKRATYGSSDDASALTVKTGGTLIVAEDASPGTTSILGIRTDGTLTVEAGAVLTVVATTGSLTVYNSGVFKVDGTVNVAGTLTVSSGGNVVINNGATLEFTGDGNASLDGTITVKSGGTLIDPDGNGHVWGGTSASPGTPSGNGKVIFEFGSIGKIADNILVGTTDDGVVKLASGAKFILTKDDYQISAGNATLKKDFGVGTGTTLIIDAGYTFTIDVLTGDNKALAIAGGTVTGGDGAIIDIKSGSNLIQNGTMTGVSTGTHTGAKTTTCTGGTWSSL
jgi:hypothetical protein